MLLFFFMTKIINIYRVLTMCLAKNVTSDIVILFNLLKKCPRFHFADEDCDTQPGSVSHLTTEPDFETKSL